MQKDENLSFKRKEIFEFLKFVCICIFLQFCWWFLQLIGVFEMLCFQRELCLGGFNKMVLQLDNFINIVNIFLKV